MTCDLVEVVVTEEGLVAADLHITELGINRISRNLGISAEAVLAWCRNTAETADLIMTVGKNHYVYKDGYAITVNRYSNTVITAHKLNARIRVMIESDYVCLREFLYQAIYLPEGSLPPDRSITSKPELSIYIEDYGTKSGDIGVVAEQNNQIIGAAWTRIIQGYGHISKDIPELAVSIFPEFRGYGIGTKLIKRLLKEILKEGYKGVSLSVDKNNEAVSLYLRLGFTVVDDNPSRKDILMIKYI